MAQIEVMANVTGFTLDQPVTAVDANAANWMAGPAPAQASLMSNRKDGAIGLQQCRLEHQLVTATATVPLPGWCPSAGHVDGAGFVQNTDAGTSNPEDLKAFLF
jgi:hypothetical protein